MKNMLDDPNTLRLCESIIEEFKKYKLSEGPQIFWEYTDQEKNKLDYYAIYIEILQENKYNNNITKVETKTDIKSIYKQGKKN